MNVQDKARHFASLHASGAPLVLYNVWDAAGARAVTSAGAKAIATGSWSVAAAHGYEDGEQIPLELVEKIVARIVTATPLPVSVDFEGGYASEAEGVADNVARLLDIGVIGINIEDRRVGGSGVHDIDTQCTRLRAIRQRADDKDIALFINARTDLFLQSPAGEHASHLPAAIERAKAYANAGASGFFAPGLADEGLIRELSAASPLPVNIMMMEGVPSIARLAELGVARVSHGPLPFALAQQDLEKRAAAALAC